MFCSDFINTLFSNVRLWGGSVGKYLKKVICKVFPVGE